MRAILTASGSSVARFALLILLVMACAVKPVDADGYDAEAHDAEMGLQEPAAASLNDPVIESAFEQHFAQVDTDHDGYLDYEELDVRLRPQMLHRIENKWVFDRKDSIEEVSKGRS
jgi:hypothetical protein